MKIVKLHIDSTDIDGIRTRKTFLIREFLDGVVDIVEASRPMCEADRSVVFYPESLDGFVIEVEAGG